MFVRDAPAPRFLDRLHRIVELPAASGPKRPDEAFALLGEPIDGIFARGDGEVHVLHQCGDDAAHGVRADEYARRERALTYERGAIADAQRRLRRRGEGQRRHPEDPEGRGDRTHVALMVSSVGYFYGEVFPLLSCCVRGASTSRRFKDVFTGIQGEFDIQAQMRRSVHEDDNVRLMLFKFAVYASSPRYT